MKDRFTIFSHVKHVESNGKYYGYGPYIREMDLWARHFESVEVVANLKKGDPNVIDLPYDHQQVKFTELVTFNLTSIKALLHTLLVLPKNLLIIYKAMRRADHIHLRCPGNVGLLGCLVQILFPHKKKTAKYAGNWDPKAKQPWSYNLQKWILNNTFLTKNMQVLVYGEWEGMSKNIKPFFTATYTDKEAQKALSLPEKYLPAHSPILFMFVGTLTAGKQPLFALDLFKRIHESYPEAELHYYGEGVERERIEAEIAASGLNDFVFLHGNQTKEVVEAAYREAHFLILASRSEGWPKVVAEAMFWGTVPLATPVSCVGQMMGYGERGLLLEANIDSDVAKIKSLLATPEAYRKMSNQAKRWSVEYTLDKFEAAIKQLIYV